MKRLYRALVPLYPRSFRQEYGAEMIEVFAEAERRARADGGRSVIALWLRTVIDLGISVPAEYALEVTHMTRSLLVRIFGITSIVGGALYLTVSIVHPSGLIRAIVPGSIALLVTGVVGLNMLLAGHQGWLGRIALAFAVTGLALGFVGMFGSWVGVLNSPAATVISTGEHLGLVFIGAGLTAWGVVTIRTGVLGQMSFAPLLVGMLSLVGITFVAPSTFTVIENSVFPLIYSVGWMLLGLGLLTTPYVARRIATA